MEEQRKIEEMKQTQQPPWLVKTYYSAMMEKNTRRMTENSTSYNTKQITVLTRKPTLTDQRAQEGKYALQQYSRI